MPRRTSSERAKELADHNKKLEEHCRELDRCRRQLQLCRNPARRAEIQQEIGDFSWEISFIRRTISDHIAHSARMARNEEILERKKEELACKEKILFLLKKNKFG